MNINNKVGTNKFHFIAVLSRTLSKLAVTASKLLPLVRAALTGVAAFGINSQTTYNLLKLLVQCLFEDLLPASLTPL